MTREQLEHVLRAAAAIAQEDSLVVLGSQAVLLPYPNARAALCASREVDLYPALHPERAETLLQRIAALDPARASIDVVSAWARRRAQEAAP